MKNEFLRAITELAAEKNLPKEAILQAMEDALVSAHKKSGELTGNVIAHIDRETGEHHLFLEKKAVDDVEDAEVEMSLTEAVKFRRDAQIGDVISIEVFPSNAGRIAAQTAKQVVLQRLREAEREMVFEEFVGRETDIVSGQIQRVEPNHVVIDLGKTEAILPLAEQIRTEHYRPGTRMKFYLLEVHRSSRGPQLVVSRTHKELLRRLFELEVPEILKGVVELKSIAREAGYRSKVAVTTRQEGVDPVGSCVGLRGIRIQNIVNELNGERIDVIQWDANPTRLVANALSPAQVLTVSIAEEENTALVVVPDRQLSLAIGKEGQNARLAAKLTGWRIDIKPESVTEPEGIATAETATEGQAAPGEIEEEAAQPRSEDVEEETEGPVDSQPNAELPATDTDAEAIPTEATPTIRFAEDLLASPPADTKKKKTKSKRKERSDDAEIKKKPTKRSRRPIIEDEEDLDVLDEELESLDHESKEIEI